jgi:hypothetical protein
VKRAGLVHWPTTVAFVVYKKVSGTFLGPNQVADVSNIDNKTALFECMSFVGAVQLTPTIDTSSCGKSNLSRFYDN